MSSTIRMRSIGKRDGFTLIEILVAIILSGIIIVGLMKTFDGLINAKSYIEAKKEKIEILDKISLIMQADIRCKIGNFKIETDGMTKKLSFITTHSLFFNGAVPVNVSYWLSQDDNGKRFLYREEKDDKAGIDLLIPLTTVFSKADYKFYLNGRWQDNISQIVKISLTSKGRVYNITQRGMIEQ